MSTSHSSRDAGPTRVGGRYLLRGELGRGGMATVHRAVDEVLEREVAVKLLHAHLATDPAFLDRFRREARSAAALAHPNVVAVHDWGETDDGAYLVLQLIEGPSLREVLRRRGRLSPSQALGVLAPAAAGLGSAHRAGLVHRDVKPENLLLSGDGQVHVTDFGLARAAASATSTFGADVLVGSPHYLSPEAVRGRPLDPRADVYALGVVLFECLTGRPPHEGDSPFATAVAHTSQRVPPPSTLVPGIPPELDGLVVAATAHEPDERPEDATVFARELALAVPGGMEPLALDGLLGDTVVPSRPAARGSTVALAPGDPTTVVSGRPGPPAPPGSTGTRRIDDRDVDVAASTRTHLDDVGDESADDVDQGVDDGPGGRSRGWLVLLVVLALLAASAAGGYLVWDRVLAPVTPIPVVVGEAHGAAVADLEQAGFDVRVAQDRPNDLEVPADHVLDQDRDGDARRGATITLVLSGGPRQVTVPDVVGDTRELAEQRLADAGLRPQTTEAHDEQVAAGLVVRTDPAAAEVLDETSAVTLTVSLGPEPIDVPDVRGLDEGAAAAELDGAELGMAITGRVHDVSAPGTVVQQDPLDTTAHRGDTVDVVVSLGPAPVEVPDVRNMLVDEATIVLEELGLSVEVDRRGGFGSWLRPNRVFEQDPGPASDLLPGETVILYAYDE
ncbi:Stk1 family PASTA domain-containing Ser/Thr kinase [Egicoccus halophilus]|uniref:Stk1 family PASTA domain-containing Ser/Thr kinase n=1 Tax=Egicoccus halophilus TaxID=1670830 RepID=UPI0013EE901C|nr:Stk1 family PASTA domain-containing Ser/Thr kinase [Egicoccus halophilus]